MTKGLDLDEITNAVRYLVGVSFNSLIVLEYSYYSLSSNLCVLFEPDIDSAEP